MSDNPAAPRIGFGRLVTWGFALIGLLGALALIYIAAVVLRIERGAPREPARVAAKTADEAYSVLDAAPVAGTGLVQIVIGVPGSRSVGSGSSYGPGRPDERNVILLDPASGVSRKLLPDNRRPIVQTRYFAPVAGSGGTGEADKALTEVDDDAGEDAPERPVPATHFVLRVLAGEDPRREDVLIGALAGDSQAFVFRGIDGVDRMWMQSPARLAVLLRQDMRLHYRLVDLPTLKVVAARPIAID